MQKAGSAAGAGKTHTMEGSKQDPGVNYRAMKELFRSAYLFVGLVVLNLAVMASPLAIKLGRAYDRAPVR